jgi:prepilin-type N-terminal cleavage/methylation domain-containing protein
MKTRINWHGIGCEWLNTMKMNNPRMLANHKGFTLIELMIVIAIIGILAAVAIPNFIEYKNKSYCTATVADAGAIGGAVADYFANPANVTATTLHTPAQSGSVGRPYILVGRSSDGLYKGNTLLLSASTTIPGVAQAVPTADNWGGAAAGAYRVGANYVAFACETCNCPKKIRDSDTHWVGYSMQPCCAPPSHTIDCYYKTI